MNLSWMAWTTPTAAFFLVIFAMLVSMTVWEIMSPGGAPRKGILGFETRPLVSIDYRTDPRSSIVDGPFTMVVAGTQVKVFAWYDNEWGYANRCLDLAKRVMG